MDHLAMLSLRATLAVTGRGGCVDGCGVDRRGVMEELARMERSPVGLRRPVLILNGYHTPPIETWWARALLCRLTSHKPADFATVSYLFQSRIDLAAESAIQAVSRRWGGPGNVELDAVGISMGGLVARFAALDPAARKHPLRDAEGALPASYARLNLTRLFTFATPHDGSHRAVRVAPDEAAKDMKPGSAFLKLLNTQAREYELVCYGQRGDGMVAPERAAPPGEAAFVAPGPWVMKHFTSLHNPWFLADLARRLRGEEPLLGKPRVASCESQVEGRKV